MALSGLRTTTFQPRPTMCRCSSAKPAFALRWSWTRRCGILTCRPADCGWHGRGAVRRCSSASMLAMGSNPRPPAWQAD